MSATPYPRALTILALLLSSVTIVSVCLAIAALVTDPLLMVLFAGAAALLDLTKYLTWPLSAHLMSVGRGAIAVALILCALILAGVSGWATYDRLMSAILGSHGEAVATLQRIEDIEAARMQDLDRLATLDGDERQAKVQAAALRERGQSSNALQMEGAALRRLDSQREQVRQRLDNSSRELATLRARPARAASLPLHLAAWFCIGFALALELVPALLLTAVRGVSAREKQESASETLPETQELEPTTVADGADEHLPALLHSIAQAGPGSPIVLREFARTARIGNVRATQIFRAAEALGALRKTPSGGYVVA